mgnify:CR=1 FL=1
MIIEPDIKGSGLFIAHGDYCGRSLVAEGDCPLDAFIRYIDAAKAVLATSSTHNRASNVLPWNPEKRHKSR